MMMISVLLESRSVCTFSWLTESVHLLELPIITTFNHNDDQSVGSDIVTLSTCYAGVL